MSKKFHRSTERLVIRSLNSSDYLAWKNAYTSMLPQKNRFDSSLNRSLKDLTKLKFKSLLEQNKLKRSKEEYFDYGVFLKDKNILIGRVGLGHLIRSVTQSSFVGYALYNPYWGQGYAHEALKALIDIAFKDHKLHRIAAGIEAENKRSIKLVKKLGFRREGVSKKIVLLRGQWQDLVQYALTTDDLKMKWSGEVQMRKK